ncbi:uroporphyrinogen-III synthase [Listeria kieliensis]
MNSPVFLTREKNKNQSGLLRLQKAGIEAISIPMIETKPLGFKLKEEARHADWIFFTSQNSVRFFADRIRQFPEKMKVASIGSKTSEALQNLGVKVDFEPSLYETEAFLREWSQLYAEKTQTVLLPQSKIAKPRIAGFLSDLGISCFRLPLYDTILPSDAAANLEKNVKLYPHFIAVFASPSAWKNFKQILDRFSLKPSFLIASIGEVTTRAIEEDGYKVDFHPENYQMDDLIDLIIEESKNDDKKF